MSDMADLPGQALDLAVAKAMGFPVIDGSQPEWDADGKIKSYPAVVYWPGKEGTICLPEDGAVDEHQPWLVSTNWLQFARLLDWLQKHNPWKYKGGTPADLWFGDYGTVGVARAPSVIVMRDDWHKMPVPAAERETARSFVVQGKTLPHAVCLAIVLASGA